MSTNCGPVRQPTCLPPQGTMMFFPGIKGDKGDEGEPSTVPGPIGPAGPFGQVGIYSGPYDSGATYYDSDSRKDIVNYAGNFWITNNRNKSGNSNWGTPNTSIDWNPFGVPLPIVATKLDLLYDAFLNVSFDLSAPGFWKSHNFVQYVSGWLLTGAGRTEINDGFFIGQISTNSPRFNAESANRTMPSVGYNEFDIPAQADGDIPENPTILNVPENDDDMIFFGWMESANSFVENRFGNASQKFLITLEGSGENNSGGAAFFYIQVYYRTRDNGGAWGAWTVVGHDWYMQPLAATGQSFQITKPLRVALTGTQDIQFSAGFSKGTGGAALVAGAKISVEAFN